MRGNKLACEVEEPKVILHDFFDWDKIGQSGDWRARL